MLYIRSAAIRVKETLFTGKNHSVCLGKLKTSSEQGFIADDYSGSYFVNRKKALKIATDAGQTITKHKPVNELLSEDLNHFAVFVIRTLTNSNIPDLLSD